MLIKKHLEKKGPEVNNVSQYVERIFIRYLTQLLYFSYKLHWYVCILYKYIHKST